MRPRTIAAAAVALSLALPATTDEITDTLQSAIDAGFDSVERGGSDDRGW